MWITELEEKEEEKKEVGLDTELKEVGVDIEIERGRCGSLRK